MVRLATPAGLHDVLAGKIDGSYITAEMPENESGMIEASVTDLLKA